MGFNDFEYPFAQGASKSFSNDRFHKGSAYTFCECRKSCFPQGKLRFCNVAKCIPGIVKILMLFDMFWGRFRENASKIFDALTRFLINGSLTKDRCMTVYVYIFAMLWSIMMTYYVNGPLQVYWPLTVLILDGLKLLGLRGFNRFLKYLSFPNTQSRCFLVVMGWLGGRTVL